jgi:CBS domain containing-hemolysin-like protein
VAAIVVVIVVEPGADLLARALQEAAAIVVAIPIVAPIAAGAALAPPLILVAPAVIAAAALAAKVATFGIAARVMAVAAIIFISISHLGYSSVCGTNRVARASMRSRLQSERMREELGSPREGTIATRRETGVA